MQVRFDGTLGFPGGILDPGESPEAAVGREFAEEVGCDPGLITFTKNDHVISHRSDHTQFCLHFFAKEVTLEQFTDLEVHAPQAKHWGIEVVMCTCKVIGSTVKNGTLNFRDTHRTLLKPYKPCHNSTRKLKGAVLYS